MRVIVTGGAGFIGSHVVDALAARGDEVVVVDSLVKGKRENVPASASSSSATSASPSTTSSTTSARRPCSTSPRRPTSASRSSTRTRTPTMNVLGTIHVLEAARRHGAQVVFSSTGGAISSAGSSHSP